MKVNLFIIILLIFTYCGSREINPLQISTINNFSEENDSVKNCMSQDITNDLGYGLLLWDGECEQKIIIYEDTIFSKPLVSNDLCEKPVVCPFLCKPDYGIFHFIIINIGNQYYEVSYDNGEKKGFIPLYDFYKFVTWEDFLINHTTGVKGKDSNVTLQVVSVKDGFLIGVDDSGNKVKLKWKENNEILINIMLII